MKTTFKLLYYNYSRFLLFKISIYIIRSGSKDRSKRHLIFSYSIKLLATGCFWSCILVLNLIVFFNLHFLVLKIQKQTIHTEKSLLNLVKLNQIYSVKCICTFRIDLAPIWIPFCVKSIGKLQLRSKFGFMRHDSRKISLCVWFASVNLRPKKKKKTIKFNIKIQDQKQPVAV